MKRIAATFVLLAGLGGCMGVAGQCDQTDKKTSDGRPLLSPPPTRLASNQPVVPAAAAATWEPDAGHIANGSLEVGPDSRPSPRPGPSAVPQQYPAAPAVLTAGPVMPGGPALPGTMAPVNPAVVQAMAQAAPAPAPAPLPPSLLPMVTTPHPQPTIVTGAASPVPMPVVITPRGEQRVEPAVCYTRQDAADSSVTAAKMEAPAPPQARGPIAMPPMPAVKPPPPAADPHVVRGGVPLMRLVNTKRITLNFEVRDVGPSGLSGVELWYTQDCREWKKYDAPMQAKAYVVEVDEEGIYGFTLLAKSGIGLGKHPPAPGDQPQVWVIVDLTPPTIELHEVTPNIIPQNEQVTLKWSASDKNLSRKAISLYYAEKEDGPWKLIASNLENSGKYVWQVPSDAPPQFLVRAEAIDLAGNIGRVQWPHPVLLDSRVPSVSIINVEANGKH
jgi:hypothetical protein